MRSKSVAPATIALLASGCASGLPGLRPLSFQQPGDTRVYASYAPCPHRAGDNFAPFLAAAALEVSSKLIAGFGTALTKGAEGGQLPASVATANIEIGTELPQCLIVIRGRFTAASSGERATPLPPTADKMRLMTASGAMVDAALPTVYGLQHYVEIQLMRSRNGTAMTFGPAILYVAKSMDGSKDGDRSVSIAVKFERPGHDAIGSAVLIGNRRIGEMEAYAVDESRRLPHEAPWFATIASAGAAAAPAGPAAPTAQPASDGQLPAKPGGADQPPAKPGPSAADPKALSAAAATAAPGAANGPTPFTATVTVVETRPTKAFLAFVASVFTSLEPTINGAIKDQIDPATRRTAAEGALDKDSAYSTALASAQTALLTYCPLPAATARADLVTKSAAARVAQIAANKAALAIDLAVPFPQLVEVGSGDPTAVAACASYR